MGQELLDLNGYIRKRRKYYLATNSKGHRIVRGTTEKEYTHATISKDRSAWGFIYATFTTRLDLANRYSRNWKDSEVVEVKEITSKEARQLKKEIWKEIDTFREQEANKTALVYQVERETNDN